MNDKALDRYSELLPQSNSKELKIFREFLADVEKMLVNVKYTESGRLKGIKGLTYGLRADLTKNALDHGFLCR